jgi:hypothetical protein
MLLLLQEYNVARNREMYNNRFIAVFVFAFTANFAHVYRRHFQLISWKVIQEFNTNHLK